MTPQSLDEDFGRFLALFGSPVHAQPMPEAAFDACAGLLRHYMSVGHERGDDPVAWSRSLESAAAFTAWTWDEAAARTQEDRLIPRAGDGVPRQPRELRRPSA